MKVYNRRNKNENVPELNDQRFIVQAVESKGNNLYSVSTGEGCKDGTDDQDFPLALLPNKFRNRVWIKRGHFLIVEKIQRPNHKIFYEVIHVLCEDEIEELKDDGKFPMCFSVCTEKNDDIDYPPSSDEDDHE